MPHSSLTRRRMIAIAATALGATMLAGVRGARADQLLRWQGSALGAQASIEIHHPDRAVAERLIAQCVAMVRQLEQQFSLYRPDSAICELNRSGLLIGPDPQMVALLRASRQFAELTNGAFDPTVQPLWRLYQDHFSAHPDPDGPSQPALADALARVGHDGLRIGTDRVALMKRGAAITLNGIAQGFATDRVAELLRDAGLSTTLIDIGEIRALGARPDGRPWRVGLDDATQPGALTGSIDLVDRAVATSAGAGFRFDDSGRFTHLFDPATGRSPALYRSVSVIAPTATEADALSTAFSLLPPARIKEIMERRPNVEAWIVRADGERVVLAA
ncbi:FAD:protein FMN transferase [Rhodopseudomonas pseudopalustris]|uniref:FAD:protein FMN transferase n=1 Tax=Rhodopseudomonas pseudopalustris TaxID=1513892 RepID=A0A1H8PHX0_9BRAD|nr:FAD:protein FMN transferase [Rhodopseudomonas pseudopalustris]SEO41324.1 thiamine biosynthesis lipoprotein [Rhodopseudomonas pseudopalustris]